MRLSMFPSIRSRRVVSNGGLHLSVAYDLTCFVNNLKHGLNMVQTWSKLGLSLSQLGSSLSKLGLSLSKLGLSSSKLDLSLSKLCLFCLNLVDLCINLVYLSLKLVYLCLPMKRHQQCPTGDNPT